MCRLNFGHKDTLLRESQEEQLAAMSAELPAFAEYLQSLPPGAPLPPGAFGELN
jgi:hypothetical protein